MAALSFGQAALTGLGKIPITRVIKTSWHSASRKEDGSYKIDDVEPEPSARRLQSLVPWRTARRVDLKADAELRRQLALAEERLAELKSALDDMRAQRDAWQVMAQARIRPARRSALSRWQWLRSTE